jgi:hypothetical protein
MIRSTLAASNRRKASGAGQCCTLRAASAVVSALTAALKENALMRYLIVVMSLAVTSILPLSAAAQSQAELLREMEGTWRWTTPDGCVITRTFRADGTSRTVNGKKATESTVAPKFDKGFGDRPEDKRREESEDAEVDDGLGEEDPGEEDDENGEQGEGAFF